MQRLRDVAVADVERLRDSVTTPPPATVEDGAQRFARAFADLSRAVVLARVFIVLPYRGLPPEEQAFATKLAATSSPIPPQTRVLTLLGTAGREADWCDRRRSQGHAAIPLLNRRFVQDVPMLAQLLADLEVELDALDSGASIVSRRMLGGKNGTFYVANAATAADHQGRSIIPSKEFVSRYGIRTVFGMGGAYINETLVVAIVFTNEELDRDQINSYPTLISHFKMSTARALFEGRVFRAP